MGPGEGECCGGRSISVLCLFVLSSALAVLSRSTRLAVSGSRDQKQAKKERYSQALTPMSTTGLMCEPSLRVLSPCNLLLTYCACFRTSPRFLFIA